MRRLPTLLIWMLLTHSFARAFNRAFVRGIHAEVGRTPVQSTRLHSTLAPEGTMNGTLSQTIKRPIEMTEEEKYLFDLNGFIIVRGVLTKEEIEAANRAIDNHASGMVERSDAALRNAVKETKFYGEGPGRMDMGRVLEWGEESKV